MEFSEVHGEANGDSNGRTNETSNGGQFQWRIRLMSKRPIPVHILVDWNSELLALRNLGDRETPEVARRVFRNLCRHIGKLLYEIDGERGFFLNFRVYSGWRMQSKPTRRRESLDAARCYNPDNPQDRGLAEYSPRNLHVVRSLEFGDRLLGARDIRLCGPRTDHHLPSTFQKNRDEVWGEKMVDTALVADLLYLALEDDKSWLVVVGQDADLVPGILTADGLLNGSDRRTIFLARGGINNSNPKMMDLICRR